MRSVPLLLLLLPAGCGVDPAGSAPAATVVALPTDGIPVAPGDDLQARIDAAPAGATLVLAPGDHVGPIRIGKPLQLVGPPTAVIRGGQGSTVQVAADGVALRGFTVAGSGQRFDLMDGGVHLHGQDLLVEGVTVRESLFGLLAEDCKRVRLVGNVVIGTGLAAMGLRGDGIRLWETTDSDVRDNVVIDARDVVVWYSSRNHLSGNRVVRCRYGTHFMYSHENVVTDSVFIGDEVGIFVMYSHDLELRRNLIANSGGAAGIGLGMKESGNLTVEQNWLLANTTGIYADNAPFDLEHHNRFVSNVVRFSETAVTLHSSARRSEFLDNRFSDNGAVVKVGGQGDALGCRFAGNYYDTYQGYDLDGDGRGDVPFEFRRLSTQLESRYPELALLHGAPAMLLVDLVGEVMPLFAPRRLMVDAAPRLRPAPMAWTPGDPHAR